jgi:hypothetical protein
MIGAIRVQRCITAHAYTTKLDGPNRTLEEMCYAAVQLPQALNRFAIGAVVAGVSVDRNMFRVL